MATKCVNLINTCTIFLKKMVHDTIQWLHCVTHFLNMKINWKLVEKKKCTVLKCTKMRERVEKVDVLGWNKSNTKWTRYSSGTLLKSKLCLINLIISFATRIRLSISGTCSISLAGFTIGPPVISCINHWSGAHFPSICRVAIWKPRFKSYMYISLKGFKCCNGFSIF